MKLSLADRLALIYTSAGSLRKTAAAVGMTHQQVSRILHRNLEGGDVSHWEKKPDIVRKIDAGFQEHKTKARDAAFIYGLPMTSEVPVYVERLPLRIKGVLFDGKRIFSGTEEQCRDYMKGRVVVKEKINKRTGEVTEKAYRIPPMARGKTTLSNLYGDRVGAMSTHWLTNRLRDAWVSKVQKTKRYYQITAGSMVDVALYKRQAAKRIGAFIKRGGIDTEQMIRAREQLKNLLKDDINRARMFTPVTPLNPDEQSGAAAFLAVNDIRTKIQDRHSPAVGQPGTVLADQYLLQLDTRESSANKPKPQKAGGTARSGKRSPTRK